VVRYGSGAKYVALVLAILAFVIAVPAVRKVDAVRNQLVAQDVLPAQQPDSAATSAALGGFRGLAVDVLWIQAESLQNERQFYQLKTIYELISVLQPNFPLVWAFNAWNLSYNISAEWGRPEDKWLWIKEGIDYGNKGLRYNPDSIDLLVNTGWIYYHKIGKDNQNAAYYTKRLMEAEGVEPFEKAASYFKRALDAAQKQGEMDVLLSRLHCQAEFWHAKAVKESTGNVPETLKLCEAVHAEVVQAQMDFPSDLALEKLRTDIESYVAQVAPARR
jgi:tetratricopeptide (TPR) repeat protein